MYDNWCQLEKDLGGFPNRGEMLDRSGNNMVVKLTPSL